jgi:hypothetical protein
MGACPALQSEDERGSNTSNMRHVAATREFLDEGDTLLFGENEGIGSSSGDSVGV